VLLILVAVDAEKPVQGIFSPLPDFITSARRELMLSAVFLVFLVGAIVACQDCWMILNELFAPAVVD
jgi:hypothetical protein